MAIKLIALDLDGTTLNDDRVISRANREALEAAIEKGVNVVIATGRAYSALPEDVFEIKGNSVCPDFQWCGDYRSADEGGYLRKLHRSFSSGEGSGTVEAVSLYGRSFHGRRRVY